MTKKIILASGSPRRKELLELMGLDFEVVSSAFVEQLDSSRKVSDVASELALGKAKDVADMHPHAIVIGGDTIVTVDERQFGKPADRTEAKRMLDAHHGRNAIVTSAVAVVCQASGYEKVKVATAAVKFKPYNEQLTEQYLETGDWKDKAAAWGIQSGAAPLIDSIRGDYDTIIGLPTKMLSAMLQELGIEVHGAVELRCPVRQISQ